MNPVSVILFVGAARVKQRGQWAEPNFHLCDRYLPYARGGGYIVSGDLVKYISDNKDLLQIYNSEDVSMGKWKHIFIVLHSSVSKDAELQSTGCEFTFQYWRGISMEGVLGNLSLRFASVVLVQNNEWERNYMRGSYWPRFEPRILLSWTKCSSHCVRFST